MKLTLKQVEANTITRCVSEPETFLRNNGPSVSRGLDSSDALDVSINTVIAILSVRNRKSVLFEFRGRVVAKYLIGV